MDTDQKQNKDDLRKSRRERRMQFWAHVEEFRTRLGRVIIGLLVTFSISLAFTEQVLQILLDYMNAVKPVALHPTESIVVYFRVAMLLGVVLVMPYLLYQILAFFLPGLKRSERRILVTSVFGLGFFFALGVTFAAFVMVPLAVGYLQGFMNDLVQPTYSIDGYISFVTTIMLSAGIIFETPLLLGLIARMGLVTAKQLSKGRRVALVSIAVLAAVVTPTPDAFNMLLVMAPLVVLYEVGIFLAWLAERARRKALAMEAV
ncbi:MAG: twin-arginine translocase subunit TatC [Anaerolineales bacterium]|uniref:Sec-independent protein translocase protein TatC n=1 Tax=Candidatus Desulfolinea nitratireducens TaxID=2841698 RepID=A0A8J6TI98_9CHLR|nr:twin-arginine translocase subunit TatC [Candidatus Desulfolinea nitratireducens]